MIIVQEELIVEKTDEIVLPKIQFKTYGDIKQQTAYTGRVIPIPFVLIEYLNYMELKVFAFILDQMRFHTGCYCSQKEIAKRLGVTNIAVCQAVKKLEKMGFITLVSGSKYKRKDVNFQAIEYLTKITENRAPGAAHFLREKVGTRNVENLTPVQLSLLDNFGGCEDEIENEEYN